MFRLLREKLGLIKKKVETEKEAYSDSIFGRKLKSNKLDEILWDIELGLLESDVALPVIEEIKKTIKDSLIGKKVKRDVDVVEFVELVLIDAVRKVLKSRKIDFDEFVASTEKPVVLMFVGINGTGKTTAIAKLAYRLLKNNLSCVIAAADTFRAGAIEQLEIHASRLGVKLIKHQAGSDPAAVAFDAIEHAKARNRSVVLIDTAGRMQTNQNLMDEMKKIKRVAKPHMVIFVGDAVAGNDVVEQAKTFEYDVGIDAAILTKLDVDPKGGAVLSVAHTIGKPILYVSTGQKYEEFEEFNPEWMISKLFGKE